MSQDTFNKVVTLALLAFCMAMFAVSWLLNRPLDLNGFLILIAPILNLAITLVTNKLPDKVPTVPPKSGTINGGNVPPV